MLARLPAGADVLFDENHAGVGGGVVDEVLDFGDLSAGLAEDTNDNRLLNVV